MNKLSNKLFFLLSLTTNIYATQEMEKSNSALNLPTLSSLQLTDTSPSFLDEETKNDYKNMENSYQKQYERLYPVSQEERNLFKNRLEINKENGILYICARGTMTTLDIRNGIDMVPFPMVQTSGLGFGQLDGGFCHRGIYQNHLEIRDQFLKILKKNITGIDRVVFAGHSLGSAISVFLALAAKQDIDNTIPIKVIMMDAPRLFDKVAAKKATKILGKDNIYHIFVDSDLVNFIPPAEIGYTHFGKHFYDRTDIKFDGPEEAYRSQMLRAALTGAHMKRIDPNELHHLDDMEKIVLGPKQEKDALKLIYAFVMNNIKNSLNEKDLLNVPKSNASWTMEFFKEDPKSTDVEMVIKEKADANIPPYLEYYPTIYQETIRIKTLLGDQYKKIIGPIEQNCFAKK